VKKPVDSLPKGNRKDKVLTTDGRTMAGLMEWVSRNSRPPVRHRHLLAIVVLFGLLSFFYYLDYLAPSLEGKLSDTLFSGVHDLHRAFFLIPILYASLIFRLNGSLLASLAFLCIVLPRALYLSPYPNPLLRALISVLWTWAIGALLAIWCNRLEVEEKDRERLLAAYDEVKTYSDRLQENQAMLIQAEKLASMGQLAASIAHEVNNPLSGVLVYIQVMKKKLTKGAVEMGSILNYLSKIEAEITRSARLIQNLLEFSSQSKPKMEEVDCNEVLEKALDLAIHARSLDARVRTEMGRPPKIMADPDQLQEVLINLIMNGLQAMPSGGILTAGTTVANQEVRIYVSDTGCGIAPENMGKLFTPFFSTKQDVKGVGLGLAVSYGIVQHLNGKIEVRSTQGEGSTFTVCIPVTTKVQEATRKK
jgi:signal transduction histidine kinase